jgi:hypothetical protein
MLGQSGKPKPFATIVVILRHRVYMYAFYQELIYSARYNFSRGGRCSNVSNSDSYNSREVGESAVIPSAGN